MLVSLALQAAACGPPSVDVRVLQSLPRVARAPAAAAERALLAAGRDRTEAADQLGLATLELEGARVDRDAAAAGRRNLLFAQTRVIYQEKVHALRTQLLGVAAARVELARAKHELAKARVVDENSLPEAVDLDVPAFEAEVERAAQLEAERTQAAAGVRKQVAILKKAMHAARVASLQAEGGNPR